MNCIFWWNLPYNSIMLPAKIYNCTHAQGNKWLCAAQIWIFQILYKHLNGITVWLIFIEYNMSDQIFTEIFLQKWVVKVCCNLPSESAIVYIQNISMPCPENLWPFNLLFFSVWWTCAIYSYLYFNISVL